MAREIGATPEARIDYAAVVDEGTFEDRASTFAVNRARSCV